MASVSSGSPPDPQPCGSGKRTNRRNKSKPKNLQRKKVPSPIPSPIVWSTSTNYFPADEFGFFEKKKDLRSSADVFVLPSHTTFFQASIWIMDDLITLKVRLNKTKDLLNNLDLSPWHRHTNEMNPAGIISRHIRYKYRPEYCSQAWCKLTECLFSYDVFPKVLKFLYNEGYLTHVNTLHLCEAPGAFISATNHYLRTKYKDVEWNWMGLTLNPHYEGNGIDHMINEDKLILSSLQNWDFLKDNTGNLMSTSNIADFLARTQSSPNVYHFVTADGSIDCQLNPGEQEATVAHLQFTEIITAMYSLIPGGSFVLKIFTFLECKTICNLYLLACTFKHVHLFKPGTSKEGNSEVYVVCTDFLGIENIQDSLLILLNNIDIEVKDKALFALSDIDPIFLERILEAATFFVELQMSVILKNLSTFPEVAGVYDIVRNRRAEICAEFEDLYPLEKLPPNCSIFGHSNYTRTDASLHTDPRSEMGSFTDKRNRAAMTFCEFMRETEFAVSRFMRNIQSQSVVQRILFGMHDWGITTGRSYENILSSRFCLGKILSVRNDFRKRLWCQFRNSPCLPRKNLHYCGDPDQIINIVYKATTLTIRPQDLVLVCFREISSVFLRRTDAEVTRKRIKQLIDKLLVLTPGQSIFLCEYPLLTRLHVGLIHVLQPHFHRVHMMYHAVQGFLGIVLFRFHGFKRHSVVEGLLKDKLTSLRQSLSTRDPNVMTLEICPMKKLYNTPIFNTILAYNILNLCQIMISYIQDSRQALNQLLMENSTPMSTESSSSGSDWDIRPSNANGIHNGPGLAICPP